MGGLDMLRLAIPRRTYTNNHMDVIAAALKNVYDRRNSITTGVKIVREAAIMRHFTVELERLPAKKLKVFIEEPNVLGKDWKKYELSEELAMHEVTELCG